MVNESPLAAGLAATQSPCQGGHLHPHFTGPETEAQRQDELGLLEGEAAAQPQAHFMCLPDPTCRTGDDFRPCLLGWVMARVKDLKMAIAGLGTRRFCTELEEAPLPPPFSLTTTPLQSRPVSVSLQQFSVLSVPQTLFSWPLAPWEQTPSSP